ncbi:Maf-like protein [Clostridium senegalense]|uniref:Maf-like protein n=1 Tax=Clostridium senegalense TaxID=1465809 RepID=UPI000287C73B|nr:Maf-like protein [Clostridium senegalense]
MDIILASSSQRRRELLNLITDKFEIIPSNFDESTVSFEGKCREYVIKLSKGKALEVADRVKGEKLIIASDTIVFNNENLMLKPKDEKEAFNMLKSLSDNTHKVYSGIVVLNLKTNEMLSDAVCTEVKFSKLTDDQILEYIQTKEPMDKSGAYGIQGKAAVFIEKINGCYYNVVGLPLNRLNSMINEMGVNL